MIERALFVVVTASLAGACLVEAPIDAVMEEPIEEGVSWSEPEPESQADPEVEPIT